MYGCLHPYIYTSTNGCFDGLSRTGYNHAKESLHGQYTPAALKRPYRRRLSNPKRCRSHGPIFHQSAEARSRAQSAPLLRPRSAAAFFWRLVLYPEWERIGYLGQMRVELCGTREEAERVFGTKLREKRRRGYA